MKKILHSTLAAMMVIGVFSCKSKGNEESAQKAEIPEFPYQSYLESEEGEMWFPYIEGDGDGFNAISNKIRYLQLPASVKLTGLADTLLQLYNINLAYNTLAYDVSTAERYMEEENLGKDQADALDSINLSGISDSSLRKLLANLAAEAAGALHQGKYPNRENLPAIKEFYEAYTSFYDPFLSAHPFEKRYDPADVLENYDEIHEKAVSQDEDFREELLQMVLNEKNFEKKTILARELAYTYFHNLDADPTELVAVIDSILREGEYAPLLGELWLMWRTSLQLEILSGRSNDSAMYNLFYNDMRNRVAETYLKYINSHPADEIAFWYFVDLLMQYNIVRNSGGLMGNNANQDEMNLYYELWQKEL